MIKTTVSKYILPANNQRKTPKTMWLYKVYFTDWKGIKQQRLKRGFATAKEAKAAELEFLANHTTDCNVSFKVLAFKYLDYCKNRVAPNTYNNREKMINAHFVPAFAELSISDIDAANIIDWQNQLLERDFSDTYLHTLNSNLSMIFNFGAKIYNLSRNPVKIAGRIGEAKKDKLIFWELSDFQKFMESLTTMHHHKLIQQALPVYAMAFKILFWTGLRVGEMLALTIDDYDATNKTISVSKTLSRSGRIGPPKTKKSNRTVTLPDNLCEELNDFISSLPSCTNRIFESIGYAKLDNVMKNVLKANPSLPCITIHDYRHAHASLLISMNINLLELSNRLGHESVKISLDRYGHLYKNGARDVANQLNQRY